MSSKPKRVRAKAVEHAEALLNQFPPEARDLLSPSNPFFQSVITPHDPADDAQHTLPAKRKPGEPKPARPADGRDLEAMSARIRARASAVLAFLLVGKTHRDVEAAGYPWPFISSLLLHYPSFKALYMRCLEIAGAYRAAVRLEEAHSRAVDGWEEPVYFQGHKCGTVRRYSDKMLAMLLAGDDPAKFSPHAQVDHAHTIETGDRLSLLLEEIAARGQFNPVRDLPGNAKYLKDVDVGQPQAPGHRNQVAGFQPGAQGETDNEAEDEGADEKPGRAAGDDHFGDD